MRGVGRRRDLSRRRPRTSRWGARPFGGEVASHRWRTRPFGETPTSHGWRTGPFGETVASHGWRMRGYGETVASHGWRTRGLAKRSRPTAKDPAERGFSGSWRRKIPVPAASTAPRGARSCHPRLRRPLAAEDPAARGFEGYWWRKIAISRLSSSYLRLQAPSLPPFATSCAEIRANSGVFAVRFCAAPRVSGGGAVRFAGKWAIG